MANKALISTTEPIFYQTGWSGEPPSPVMEGNGVRVAQVVTEGNTFPVADTMFWIVCPDEIVQDVYAFNLDDSTFHLIQWEPIPATQPDATGGIETL